MQALRGVRFIAQHIKDADKDNEVLVFFKTIYFFHYVSFVICVFFFFRWSTNGNLYQWFWIVSSCGCLHWAAFVVQLASFSKVHRCTILANHWPLSWAKSPFTVHRNGSSPFLMNHHWAQHKWLFMRIFTQHILPRILRSSTKLANSLLFHLNVLIFVVTVTWLSTITLAYKLSPLASKANNVLKLCDTHDFLLPNFQ